MVSNYSTEVREFAQAMQDYWNRTHLIDNELNFFRFESLNFEFLDTDEDLERVYYDEESKLPPIELAVVFDGNPFENMFVKYYDSPRD